MGQLNNTEIERMALELADYKGPWPKDRKEQKISAFVRWGLRILNVLKPMSYFQDKDSGQYPFWPELCGEDEIKIYKRSIELRQQLRQKNKPYTLAELLVVSGWLLFLTIVAAWLISRNL